MTGPLSRLRCSDGDRRPSQLRLHVHARGHGIIPHLLRPGHGHRHGSSWGCGGGDSGNAAAFGAHRLDPDRPSGVLGEADGHALRTGELDDGVVGARDTVMSVTLDCGYSYGKNGHVFRLSKGWARVGVPESEKEGWKLFSFGVTLKRR